MTTISSACARLRLSFEAEVTGIDSPLGMKSYLHFTHYKRTPPPDVDDSAPCVIRLTLDYRMDDTMKAESKSWDIHKGCLILTRGTPRRPAGYLLPADAFEPILLVVKGAMLEIKELGWNASEAMDRLADKSYWNMDRQGLPWGPRSKPPADPDKPCLLIPSFSIPPLGEPTALDFRFGSRPTSNKQETCGSTQKDVVSEVKKKTVKVSGLIIEHWMIPSQFPVKTQDSQ